MARPAWCRTAVLLAAIYTAAAVTGCGGGRPSGPPSPFPPRPESIDVSRLDPCTAVTPADADRFDLGRGTPNTATVNGTRSPACTWISEAEAGYGYGVQTVPLSAAGAAQEPGSRIVDVDGFGAVQGARDTNNRPGRPAFCQIAVDVADNQTLRIQVNDGDASTGGNPAEIDAACGEARRFASWYLAAIRT